MRLSVPLTCTRPFLSPQDIVHTEAGQPIVLFYSPRKFRDMYERWLNHYLETGDGNSFLPEQEVLGLEMDDYEE